MGEKVLHYRNAVDQHLQFLAGEIHLENVVAIVLEIFELAGGNQRSPAETAYVFSDRVRTSSCAQLGEYVTLLRRSVAEDNSTGLLAGTERGGESNPHATRAILHRGAAYG
jgi:hypothetical protein